MNTLKNVIVDIGATGFPAGGFGVKNIKSKPYEIHLFEPRWENISKDAPVRKELSAKGYNNDYIFLYNEALSDKQSVTDFYLTKKANCSSLRKPNSKVLSNRKDITNYRIIQVPTNTLDNILGHLPYINYLKLDTQGSEYEILLGASKMLLKTHQIKCETANVETYIGQKTKNKIIDLLKTYNFEVTKTETKSSRESDIFFINKNFNETTN